jgi:uncharacterized membrane protein HdeD (DUF308 family)
MLADTLPPWWLLLITGVAWTRSSPSSCFASTALCASISLLFGFVALAAGFLEIGMIFWPPLVKLLNAILAFVFIAAAWSRIHPGDTFLALAAIFSFFLIFSGTFDLITAISARHEVDMWWLQLIGGIIQIALGFWAAGYYGRSAVLLVAWVAAWAIIRGVRDIVLAFRVREVQHAPSAA